MGLDWIELGSETMREARSRLGLSYEGVSRKLNVSSKTYERYEKRGAVPTHMLELVAGALGLELERPALAPVRVNGALPTGSEDRVLALLEEAIEILRELRDSARNREAPLAASQGS